MGGGVYIENRRLNAGGPVTAVFLKSEQLYTIGIKILVPLEDVPLGKPPSMSYCLWHIYFKQWVC